MSELFTLIGIAAGLLVAWAMFAMSAPQSDSERDLTDEEQLEYLNAYVADFLRHN